MILIRKLLMQHGYSFVFLYVFGVQIGLPIPADPILLVMGGITGEGRYSFSAALLSAVAGALAGDLFWYELGRLRGRSIVKLLCKWAIEPDTCVRSTEDSFAERGARTLLIAKFVPGMSLVSVPMAGMIKMPRWRFLLWDAAGSGLWALCYLTTGVIFSKQIAFVIEFLSQLGRGAVFLLICCLGAYIGFRYLQRWRVVRAFRKGRISPEAVYEKLNAGEVLTIVDLRHRGEVERERLKLPGAIVMSPTELRSRSGEIPRHQEIILYCS